MDCRIPVLGIGDFIVLFALAAGPALAADNRLSVPNLNGAWARTTFAIEQPASGPGPLRDSPRRGDQPPAYTSPMLKHQCHRPGGQPVQRGAACGGALPPD
jgi:hypothetical protein